MGRSPTESHSGGGAHRLRASRPVIIANSNKPIFTAPRERDPLTGSLNVVRFLHQPHFRKRQEKGQRGFRPLVFVAPVRVQPIAATTGLRGSRLPPQERSNRGTSRRCRRRRKRAPVWRSRGSQVRGYALAIGGRRNGEEAATSSLRANCPRF
jgi:hypothetical protein